MVLESTNLDSVEIESLVLVVSVVVELDSESLVDLSELSALDLLVSLSLLNTGSVGSSVLEVDDSLVGDGGMERFVVNNPSSSLLVGLDDVSPSDALVLSVDWLVLDALLTVSSDAVIFVGVDSVGLANLLLSSSNLGSGGGSS